MVSICLTDTKQNKVIWTCMNVGLFELYDDIFYDRREYEKMTCSAMRTIFQQGEPSLRISAAMTRHLHSSTLSGS